MARKVKEVNKRSYKASVPESIKYLRKDRAMEMYPYMGMLCDKDVLDVIYPALYALALTKQLLPVQLKQVMDRAGGRWNGMHAQFIQERNLGMYFQKFPRKHWDKHIAVLRLLERHSAARYVMFQIADNFDLAVMQKTREVSWIHTGAGPDATAQFLKRLTAAMRAKAETVRNSVNINRCQAIAERIEKGTKRPEDALFLDALYITQMEYCLYREGTLGHDPAFNEYVMKFPVFQECADQMIHPVVVHASTIFGQPRARLGNARDQQLRATFRRLCNNVRLELPGAGSAADQVDFERMRDMDQFRPFTFRTSSEDALTDQLRAYVKRAAGQVQVHLVDEACTATTLLGFIKALECAVPPRLVCDMDTVCGIDILWLSLVCSNCRVLGHLYSDCPQMVCHLCLGKGHLKARCPKRFTIKRRARRQAKRRAEQEAAAAERRAAQFRANLLEEANMDVDSDDADYAETGVTTEAAGSGESEKESASEKESETVQSFKIDSEKEQESQALVIFQFPDSEPKSPSMSPVHSVPSDESYHSRPRRSRRLKPVRTSEVGSSPNLRPSF